MVGPIDDLPINGDRLQDRDDHVFSTTFVVFGVIGNSRDDTAHTFRETSIRAEPGFSQFPDLGNYSDSVEVAGAMDRRLHPRRDPFPCRRVAAVAHPFPPSWTECPEKGRRPARADVRGDGGALW